MKKYLIIILVLLVVGGIGVYQFLYQDHRDINAEKGMAVTVKELISAFEKDETVANKKYLDQSVVVQGKVTSVEAASNSVVIDEKLFCVLKTNQEVLVNTPIVLKGRLIGFDNLISEIKLDQCTLQK